MTRKVKTSISFPRRILLKTIGLATLASLVEPMRAITQSSLTTSSTEGKTGTDVSEQIKSQNKQNIDRLFLPDSIPYPNGITVTSDGLMFVGSVTTVI